MTRDVEARLGLYSKVGNDYDEDDQPIIQVHRLALNMDQVNLWTPPPNPAKETDSRFEKYRDEYGDESWELDAVEPAELRRLVEGKIKEFIDTDIWDTVQAEEEAMRNELKEFADQYEKRKNKKTARRKKGHNDKE